MAQDLLQIALEHHRAGRVKSAEAAYRALLEKNADDADALYWLGVLAVQAGRADHAVSLLERACEYRPADASFEHARGQAYLLSGRKSQAIDAFKRAGERATEHGEIFLALGAAYLDRRDEGDAVLAVEALEHAASAGIDTAELHHYRAVALLACGRAEDACRACDAALEKKADFSSAFHYKGLALRALGDLPEARKALLKAAELNPDSPRVWYALAMLDVEAGNLEIAASLFRRAIKVKPNYPAAHQGLARTLEAMGKREEAMNAFAAAVRASRGGRMNEPRRLPANATLETAVADLDRRLTSSNMVELHHALAGKLDMFAPALIPSSNVAKLFDRYAETFDDHLRVKLHYGVPELITEAIARAASTGGPNKALDILELGCGTGLCGPMLRPLAETLWGVDLSPGMIEKARAREVYDKLEVGELVAALRAAEPASFDVLVAADVMVYIGDLSPTFEMACRVLRPGGLLAFTVECGAGERFFLHKETMRYSHSREYVRHVAEIFGFQLEALDTIVGRYERGKPVHNYLAVARWPEAR